MDSVMPLSSHGFDSVDTINKDKQDVTVSTQEAAPHVNPTTEDFYNMHGDGAWDNTVYGGDPYSTSTPNQDALDGLPLKKDI